MSRNLPPYPNLEHLKKPAKELLRDLQQQNPALKLADAQYRLAREYGFASWPKLKAYVEALPPPVTPTEATAAMPAVDSNDGSVHPFVGEWRANLSKSRRHPGNLFQSAKLQFSVDQNIVTVTDLVIDDSGREASGKNTIQVDGNEHPSDNGYVLIARWHSRRVLETFAKKDGQIVGWGTYEVSADGKTLTISSNDQRIVLERE